VESILTKSSKRLIFETLGLLLPQLLSNESVLCTDGAHVYKAVAKAYAIPHESLSFGKHGRVKARVFHIQNVNAYDSRLKGWMKRFAGVATKCLPNDLGWKAHDRARGQQTDAPPRAGHGPGGSFNTLRQQSLINWRPYELKSRDRCSIDLSQTWQYG